MICVKKIKLLILCLLIVALIAGTTGIFFYKAPNQVFQRIFHFELPTSSQIIHSDISILRDVTYMKIQINKDELVIVEGGLLQHYGNSQAISDYSWIPPCQNIPWWDLNEAEIVVAYVEDESGKIAKTKSTYAIVTEDKNSQFFLYVARA
jgi:hypothetical protein